MKKNISMILVIVVFISCESTGPSHEEILASNNLELLQRQRSEYNQQLNLLSLQLEEVNAKIGTFKTQEKLTLVTAFEIKPQVFKHYISVQGNVKTRQNLDLLSEFGGKLKKIYVNEGQSVKKGKLLAEIDDAGMKDQLEQLQLQTELARTTFERTKRLWEQKIGSEIGYLQARTSYETQKKQIAQMKDRLSNS